MSDRAASGYDTAQSQKNNDDLGRWRFASEIAEVIRSTPAEWSARIGIFGKWGEGKSTTLNFLKAQLEPEGNVMFYFNPWAIQDLNELWAEFGGRLIEALTAANLIVEPPWKQMVRRLHKSIGSTGLASLGEGAADMFGKGKLYTSAVGLLGNWLRPDGPQVKKIRKGLGRRRVIVLIDELDRTTPELLPKLLLSLREILDLPGFTFVLAFDNEIVAGGLVTANKAWGDGGNFLDKILDFKYFLPPVSNEGKRLLLNNMLEQYCSFVPHSSITPIEHLLPENPRKLKTLIRSLISLKPQLARHDADELNWVEIWLAEMIRQESYPFFLRILDDDTLSDLVGIGYQLKDREAKKRSSGAVTSEDDDIKKLIDEVGGIDEKQSTRLNQLIKATRKLAGYNLLYNWKFALRPEALTWKEFCALLGCWKKKQDSDTISAWIVKHSVGDSIDQADIEHDLFEAMLNAKEAEVSQAADAPTVEDNAGHCAEAGLILRMTAQFLELAKLFTADRFKKLYGKSTYWIAFRFNPADADLRGAEREVLFSLLERSSDDEAPALLRALQPWDPWPFRAEDAESVRLKRDLRDGCVNRILPKAERAFIKSLSQPECIRQLADGASALPFNYLLFSGDRLPWSNSVRAALLDMIGKAKNDAVEYEKATDLLRLLTEAAENRLPSVGRESAVRIVADEEFVGALWRGVTSRHIQFRMLKLYLSNRSVLVKLGVREGILPLTPELEEVANQSSEGEEN